VNFLVDILNLINGLCIWPVVLNEVPSASRFCALSELF